MKQLQHRTNSAGSSKGCAAEILETVPTVMQFIRAQMRRHRGSDLSVPQFRALAFVSREPGTSLSAVAEFLGLSRPATSQLVEGLVRKGLAVRRIPPGNRRTVALSISGRGEKTVSAARQATERRLSEVMASLGDDDCAIIQRALRALREEFMRVAAPTDW